MSSQILITGATGFIGRQLTRDLVKQGRAVRVLARNPSKAKMLFGDSVEICPGDLADDGALRRGCSGIETIYHIAGCYRFGLRHRRELWRTNVVGTEALLNAAAARGVARIVHLSSAGVLGRGGSPISLGTPLTETDFPATPPAFSAYKASKWHAEKRALAAVRKGLPVVIASTSCPIGRGDDLPTPTGQMILDFLRGRFPFYCRTGLNFIAVEDLSSGLQRAAEQGRPGERYLLSGENIWLHDFLQLLAEETGLPAPKICLPGPVVGAIGWGGELYDLLCGGSRNARVCLETALQASRAQFFANAKAQRELGWSPQFPLTESLRRALAWFRHEAVPERMPVASPSLESHVR